MAFSLRRCGVLHFLGQFDATAYFDERMRLVSSADPREAWHHSPDAPQLASATMARYNAATEEQGASRADPPRVLLARLA